MSNRAAGNTSGDRPIITVYYDDTKASTEVQEAIAQGIVTLKKFYQFQNVKISTAAERAHLRTRNIPPLPVMIADKKLIISQDCVPYIKSLLRAATGTASNMSVFDYQQNVIADRSGEDDRDDKMLDNQTLQMRMQELSKKRENRISESMSASTKKSNAARNMPSGDIDDQFVSARDEGVDYEVYRPSADNILDDYFGGLPDMHTAPTGNPRPPRRG